MARRIVQVEPGLLRIEQRLRIPGIETGIDASGPACIYALVQVRRGVVAYQHGDAHVRAPRCFALFLPPCGIVQASLERCDVTSIAVAFRPLTSDDLPRKPMLFAGDGSVPSSRRGALARIRTAATTVSVSRDRTPGPLAATAKTIIDREYVAPLEIAGIAARLQDLAHVERQQHEDRHEQAVHAGEDGQHRRHAGAAPDLRDACACVGGISLDREIGVTGGVCRLWRSHCHPRWLERGYPGIRSRIRTGPRRAWSSDNLTFHPEPAAESQEQTESRRVHALLRDGSHVEVTADS